MKQETERKLLRFLIAMVMAIGMMLWMVMTVYAATEIPDNKTNAVNETIGDPQDDASIPNRRYTIQLSELHMSGEGTRAVKYISFEKSVVSVTVGKKITLMLTFTPSDATYKTVIWSSDNTSIATVDKNRGVVTSVKEGVAFITATATNGTDSTEDDRTATCKVIVTKRQWIVPKKVNKVLSLKGTLTGSKLTAKWTRIPDASMYKVYGSYCGRKMKLQKTLKGSNTTKAVFTKLNGKNLNLKKEFKFQVAAYKKVNGKMKLISRSYTVHIAGRKNAKYTNARAVKITKKKYRLKAGKKAKIKARLVLANIRKKALPASHTPRFRYTSSNKAVASVSKSGEITAKAAGSCKIYVYAANGCKAKIRVDVK